MEYLLINFDKTYELFRMDDTRKRMLADDINSCSSGEEYTLRGICGRIKSLEEEDANIIFFHENNGMIREGNYQMLTEAYELIKQKKAEKFLTTDVAR